MVGGFDVVQFGPSLVFFGQLREDGIDEAVLVHFIRGEPEVSFAVGLDLGSLLAGAFCVEVVDLVAKAENVPSLDLEIGGLPLEHAAEKRLVHEVL
jgi:hypothetical protein